jgi:hypothetical protein
MINIPLGEYYYKYGRDEKPVKHTISNGAYAMLKRRLSSAANRGKISKYSNHPQNKKWKIHE